MSILKLIFTVVFLLYIFNSCIKEDVGNIGSDVTLTPEYAIPIGSPEFDMNEFFDSETLGNPLDTSLIDDTTSLIAYDNQYYNTPYEINHTEVFPISLSSLEGSEDYFTSIMFRTNAVNKIPAQIQTQIYFLNASSVIIDSLYTNGPLILESAEVNENGDLLKASELWKYDVFLSQQAIEQFTQVSYIQITSKLHIANSSAINSFYSSQDLWIQLGAKIRLNISENEQ